jgi:DNA-binding LacI/PurR family transcriptional regulator
MITGPPGYRSTYSRTEGYRLALEAAGIVYNPLLVEEGDWLYESGYQAMKRLLAKSVHLTALFAQSDQMAIAAMRALHEAGRSIPEDMSIVGYDDIPVAAYTYPPLTTIRQPMRGVGQQAIRLLIEAIDNPNAGKRELLLEPMLIVRHSASQARIPAQL